MLIGIYIRELWRHKLGLALAAVIAALATAQVVGGVSFFPPRVGGSSLEMASASAHVMVDTPRSSAVDPKVDAYTLESLSNRALILGNVMASPPVREYIARRAGVPSDRIRVEPPLTPEQPRPLADSLHAAHVSDIFRRPDEYRLSVQVDPMAPVMDIYAVAPTTAAAERLASASVDGLRDYLGSVAAKEQTPDLDRVRLEQLGTAQAGSIDEGVSWQLGLVTFLFVFALCCTGCLLLVRVRRGWSIAPPRGEATPAQGA